VDRSKVQLATKFAIGFDGVKLAVRGDPAYVRQCCEGSLQRLGLDYIDLYYQHRVDTSIPIEVTVRPACPDMPLMYPRYRAAAESCIDLCFRHRGSLCA